MRRIFGDATALAQGVGLARAATQRATSVVLLVLVACATPAGIELPRASGGGVNAGSGGQSGESSMSEAGAGSTELGPTWCDALEVIQHKCQRCHHDPPEHGAPFALVTYGDTQSIDGRGVLRFERMRDAIESGFMPATFLKLEPAVEPLDGGEKALLLEWLSRGARAVGGTRCSADAP